MLKSYIFYDVDIHYNFIRQKLILSVSDFVFEHKYENKYDISNIRPYPIRLHPFMHLILKIKKAVILKPSI